jgi:glycine/D-amino acid oxidase-like deaminating enzyme
VELRGAAFLRLPEVNVGKREMLSALARGLDDRILRGTVASVQCAADGSIRMVEVAPASGSDAVVFAPGAVIVAAGTGSKALLRRLGADELQIKSLKHRRVHVLCVRGPSSVLPALNLVSPADLLFVAAHEHEAETTYYATPMQFRAPHVEEVPDDASADVDEAFAQRGWDALFRIFPALGSLPGLRFATYAGFRQDVGDQPGVPKCERIEAVPNVIAALPSGLLGAWPVAMRAAALVAEITIEKRPQPTIPVAVMGARVGDNHEDAGGTEWSAEPPQG